MNEENKIGYNQRDKLINEAIGLGLVVFGVYLLYGLLDKRYAE